MRRNTLLILILLIGLGVATAVAAKDRTQSNLPELVRVAIVRDSREVELAINGNYHLRDEYSNEVGKGVYLPESKVRLLNRGFFMGLNVYHSKRLTIIASREASITIDGRAFRGGITFIRTPDNRITVVNTIDVEDYIKGVLYHEVSHHWPMEALKAQAVAARTYALYSIRPSSSKPYDVTNDIYSQVYGGRDSERYRTDLAVDYTHGQILTYNGKIIPAYFHATCGGATEDAKEVWNIDDIPPLRGVPCSFCQTSPHLHWKKNFRLKDIQDALNLHGFKVGPIQEMTVVDRDRSDRIDHLKITEKDGRELVMKGKDFRDIMGPNVLMSNNYQIIMKGYYVDIIGKGWGHGVGLCQWGAFGMAQQQFNFKQILAYYYPQSVLMDYHELSSK